MSVINKLFTLARGTARASAQVVVDANAQQIYEQEIVDAERVIQGRKRVLTEVIADEFSRYYRWRTDLHGEAPVLTDGPRTVFTN